MNITLPNFTNLIDVPFGNFTVNIIKTECVYPVYNNLIIINVLFLLILELGIHRRIKNRIKLDSGDFVHRRIAFLLSDGFFIGSLFVLNFYMLLYTFLYVPYLLPMLS